MAGCDSSFILNLTVLTNSSASLAFTSCDSLAFFGQVYTSGGSYTQTIYNTAGCDSLVTLDVILNHANDTTLILSGCDDYLLNNIVYTASGIYTQTFLNTNGCDSLVHLDLTINQSTDSIINAVSCNLYSLNGQTYTNSGSYAQVFTNAAGCDSIVSLQLSIDTLNATITINGITISTPAIGSYQWIDCNSNTPIPGATNLDFIPTVSGSYAVIVTSATCIDTSICLTMWMTATTNIISDDHDFIYPNPTIGKFTIELKEDALLTITTTLGEPVLLRKYTQGKHTVDISNQDDGVYIMKINQEVYKLIVSK